VATKPRSRTALLELPAEVRRLGCFAAIAPKALQVVWKARFFDSDEQ
jgi:hypothetical protein